MGGDLQRTAPLPRPGKCVAERTRDLAGPDRFDFEALGTVTVRGRSQPVTIYRIDTRPPDT